MTGSRARAAAGVLAATLLATAAPRAQTGSGTAGVGPRAAARQAATAGGPSPTALARWWDAHHLALPVAPLFTHADVIAASERAVAADPDRVTREEIGRSVEGRPLFHLAIGRGPRHVLLWSQMHGDEPSATPALFDLLEWLRREAGSAAAARIHDRLTLHVVPMLNPDGAERFQRRNAQGIDVNRDALRLQSPEGRALKALRDRVQPVLGFNLHNQNLQTSVGAPPRPATISLLAVAHDPARTDSPRRRLAKRAAVAVRDALEPFIPGQMGRYSDEFEVRAFGDNIARWGTGVLLIETGALAGDDVERRLTRLNFVALVSALDALASGRLETLGVARYESLPTNDSMLLHTLVTNATIVNGAGVPPFTGDIGLSAARVVREQDGRRTLRLSARIADLGDLRVYGALQAIDATGLTAMPMPAPDVNVGDEIRMPDWSAWKGPTLSVGQPGAFVLVSPIDGREGTWRVVRVVSPEHDPR